MLDIIINECEFNSKIKNKTEERQVNNKITTLLKNNKSSNLDVIHIKNKEFFIDKKNVKDK